MREDETLNNENNLKEQLIKYIVFWPFFLISVIFFIASAFLYLRYTSPVYNTAAKIEIIDKSQDADMALPTAMTIFNRSMINLENEIGSLNSYRLHENVVKKLGYNIEYYIDGRFVKNQKDLNEIFDDNLYYFKLLIKPEEIKYFSTYMISFSSSGLNIEFIDYEGFSKFYDFENNSTKDSSNDLPFEIAYKGPDLQDDISYIIKFYPLSYSVNKFKRNVKVSKHGNESDQLNLNFDLQNKFIAQKYLSELIYQFDYDGIRDRQLVFKNTMDFVDSRYDILYSELEKIEIAKQNFKEDNNLTDLSVDASFNLDKRSLFQKELFAVENQKDLAEIIYETLMTTDFQLMPINIGIENQEINSLIGEYNQLVNRRNKFLNTTGSNNIIVINIENDLNALKENIKLSLKNYQKGLDVKLLNIESQDTDFQKNYSEIPEKEKILRSIERELEIKESLFLLLLQKKEEAAINYAVVKPTLKVIDYPRSTTNPVTPIPSRIYLFSLILGLGLPFTIFYLIFITDTKIHTKSQLKKLLKEIPVIGEVPFIKNFENKIKSVHNLRAPIYESFRMIVGNINFYLKDSDNNSNKNVILVTSSIKGEGKTLISVNLSLILSSKFNRVLLIGADLRNPQIHKSLNVDKNVPGLSDYIYKQVDWKKFLIKETDNLDILLSGTIPPNPTKLLSSEKFKKLINEVSSTYDYVIIDSAPCLLVSDTFEISRIVGSTIYAVRSNHSDKKLCEFIDECHKDNKLPNISIVLNGLGARGAYGYKYNYQYGYQYGYKYGYNYGYGYGYNEDKSD
tara:strand:+ start:577 stop:2955 length:2379 start_codon:yes stop_codon:yes gene_type:complete